MPFFDFHELPDLFALKCSSNNDFWRFLQRVGDGLADLYFGLGSFPHPEIENLKLGLTRLKALSLTS